MPLYNEQIGGGSLRRFSATKTTARVFRLAIGTLGIALFVEPGSDVLGFLVFMFIAVGFGLLVANASLVDDEVADTGLFNLLVPATLTLTGTWLVLIGFISTAISNPVHHGIMIFGCLVLLIPYAPLVYMFYHEHCKGTPFAVDWNELRKEIRRNR